MQHLKIGYTDVLNMPTNERRFYLGLLVKKRAQEQDHYEKMNKTPNSKGERKTKISGSALKTKIKSGEIPLN